MADKQPLTIAEYNALSISNALNFGYYFVQGARVFPRYSTMVKPRIELAIGSWKVFLAHHPYVKFGSRRSLKMEQHPGWRFGSPGFQEIDTMQSNVVWYKAERVVCLYHQASLGANFMDAYMRATAFRQIRQDRLRQQTCFPIAGLASLVVTDANRKSLAGALEAPRSDAALASKCIGHCPILWFSQPFLVPAALHIPQEYCYRSALQSKCINPLTTTP